MDFIAGCVTRAKRQYTDPFVIIAGDFNQWMVEKVLADHIDIQEPLVGPTRSGRSIDQIFTNFAGSIMEARTVPPLETDNATVKKSDHPVSLIKSNISRISPVKWLEYSYRYYNADSAKMFGARLAHKRWGDLEAEETSNGRAGVYQ